MLKILVISIWVAMGALAALAVVGAVILGALKDRALKEAQGKGE